jgi:hypothetical protein
MMSDSKPPPKHSAHGNYRRADWFEAEYERVEAARKQRVAELEADLKQANDAYDAMTRTAGEAQTQIRVLDGRVALLEAALVWTIRNARTCIAGADVPGGFSLWSVPAEFAPLMTAAHAKAFSPAAADLAAGRTPGWAEGGPFIFGKQK